MSVCTYKPVPPPQPRLFAVIYVRPGPQNNQHTFITAPDRGIGNLSLVLISLKLQFTWIFVGVLGAGCSLADGPGLLALLALLRSLTAPQAAGGNVSAQQQSLKVTFQSDISKHVVLLFLQRDCFCYFPKPEWVGAADGIGVIFRGN